MRAVQGHFQIVLSRKHSPFLVKGLSPFMRIMYCSGVWSYIVGAITTPLFIIIPLLTIWAGIFPIVISWWAALGLTIYYVAQSMVLNYSKKVSHCPESSFRLQHVNSVGGSVAVPGSTLEAA